MTRLSMGFCLVALVIVGHALAGAGAANLAVLVVDPPIVRTVACPPAPLDVEGAVVCD